MISFIKGIKNYFGVGQDQIPQILNERKRAVARKSTEIPDESNSNTRSTEVSEKKPDSKEIKDQNLQRVPALSLQKNPSLGSENTESSTEEYPTSLPGLMNSLFPNGFPDGTAIKNGGIYITSPHTDSSSKSSSFPESCSLNNNCDKNIYKIASKMLKFKEKLKGVCNALFKSRKINSFPKANVHEHMEGTPTYQQLEAWVKKYKLYWDPEKQAWRRTFKPHRISLEQLYNKTFIKDHACVSTSATPDMKNLSNPGEKFDKTFRFRGSIMDRIPLSEQFLAFMENSVKHNVIYNELMFGVYDIPVPKAFETFVNQFQEISPKEMLQSIDFLKHKKLIDILNGSEKIKLKRKVIKRFGEQEGTKHFDELIKLSYIDAFDCYLRKVLIITEKEIRKTLSEIKDKNHILYNLDPNIFDAKSPKTLKLIFEVMRHYGLPEYLAWLMGSSQFIENDNSILVGLTVDGPQLHPNSIKNFHQHINALETVRRLYPKAKMTIHALEMPEGQFDEIHIAQKELSHVLKVADRISHIPMFEESNDLICNLKFMQERKIGIETCLTTGHETTNIPLKGMSLNLYYQGFPVSLNTDDPGIVFTNIYREIIKAIENFDLNYEDIENMMRNAVHSSFLSGGSIYSEIQEYRNHNEGTAVIMKYELKDQFENIVNKSMEAALLLEKLNAAESAKIKDLALMLNEYFPEGAFKENSDNNNDCENQKEHYLDEKWKNGFIAHLLKNLNLSDKEYKEMQLEIALKAAHVHILFNEPHYRSLGYLPLERRNSK